MDYVFLFTKLDGKKMSETAVKKATSVARRTLSRSRQDNSIHISKPVEPINGDYREFRMNREPGQNYATIFCSPRLYPFETDRVQSALKRYNLTYRAFGSPLKW